MSDPERPPHVEPAPHEFAANYVHDGHGLTPWFACYRAIRQGGGSVHAQAELGGEWWNVTLYFQESGIVHPGETNPQGTEFAVETMREFRLSVKAVDDEAGQRSFNVHLAPRWQGMRTENDQGDVSTLPIPKAISEAVNVRVNGSNIDFTDYQELIARSFGAVGVTAEYWRDPNEALSNVQDAERYVRLSEDRSGPIHARDGPIARLGHLLEHDRDGYRKLVQDDSKTSGYYHTVTLGPSAVSDAWPGHTFPREIKHYYAREFASMDASDPLRHPKVGVSYQANRWDETIGITADELADLEKQLDETLISVLAAAGVSIRPADMGMGGDGGGGSDPAPFVRDAYFRAVETDEPRRLVSLDLAEIESHQENVVITTLADGLSPVQWESLETLIADGGTVAPADIADENGRHVDSVYRALDGIREMVDREYGAVALRSNHVAELVHDAVREARESTRRAAEAGAKAVRAAERGLEDSMSAFQAWAARFGVDPTRDAEGYVELDLGRVEGDDQAAIRRQVRAALREGFRLWTDAGQDPSRYMGGQYRMTLEFDRFADCHNLTDIRRQTESGRIGPVLADR